MATTLTTPREVQKARRALDNLRGFVRRTGLTGWVDRSAKFPYAAAFAAVVAVEDALGVESPEAVRLGDRLLALRDEARAAGLLTNRELLDAEASVL